VFGVVFMPINILAGVGGMSEFSMMTSGIPWPLAYGALILGMGLVGWGTYVGLKHVEARKAKRAARGAPSPPAPPRDRLQSVTRLRNTGCQRTSTRPPPGESSHVAHAQGNRRPRRAQGNAGPPRVSLPPTGAGWAEPGPGGTQGFSSGSPTPARPPAWPASPARGWASPGHRPEPRMLARGHGPRGRQPAALTRPPARKHRLARHPHRSNIQSGGYTPAAAQPRRPGAASRQRPALIGRRP
jgi:hypothetical protein